MFILTTVVDTIRIPSNMLSIPTMTAVHQEMDRRYPNRVLMDVGLVVCRYGNCLKIGDGILVNGDGGSHHECLVKLVIFRPFIDEVCTGYIKKSTPDGIQVSLGFFQDIFIPPYWMLRPSHYESKTGLWIWSPDYGEGDDDDDDDDDEDNENKDKDKSNKTIGIKVEEQSHPDEGHHDDHHHHQEAAADNHTNDNQNDDEDDNRYEMEIGAEIRFKVKSINFTQVTNTAKGMQATTSTTAQAAHPNNSFGSSSSSSNVAAKTSPSAITGDEDTVERPVRKRSLSVDLSESHNIPASMHVVASICEDGLGLTSWWAGAANQDEEDGEEGAEGDDE